jgi:hypothetical protein
MATNVTTMHKSSEEYFDSRSKRKCIDVKIYRDRMPKRLASKGRAEAQGEGARRLQPCI